ncbi:hypothetical protein BGW80DRAFT_1258399 [Lactifluus volemus]|nr:hypothetical protein BGW80DRAFT_1258399 [Lactifluus volemus]
MAPLLPLVHFLPALNPITLTPSELMIGFDGIVLINVVSNPEVDTVTGIKNLQMHMTHDGGIWTQLILIRTASRMPVKVRPSVVRLIIAVGKVAEKLTLYVQSDVLEPRCVACTFNTPAALLFNSGFDANAGFFAGVVDEYTDSGLLAQLRTCDAGFTWEEVHKDAHL